MTAWKNGFVWLVLVLLSVSSPLFVLTGYTALYWAWLRGNLLEALPYLPWARGFGLVAITSAAVAIAILFSSRLFPLQTKTRLWLSIFATATIALFAEFRNEGKFHLGAHHHFFAPESWIRETLDLMTASLGSFLYRLEYSHWNDFLMGPAIVSVLYSLAFINIYSAAGGKGNFSLSRSNADESTEVEYSQRFARMLMNVGLFWFFIQAWSEKAGYLRNPHSRDEIDFPFEFVGTMVGFWMARVLTKPLDNRPEPFKSTFFIDFVASGVIGLVYTLVICPLTRNISRAVAHALYQDVPSVLDVHEYTSFEQYVRPLELLLLAAATWWIMNYLTKRDETVRLGIVGRDAGFESSLPKSVEKQA